MAGEDWPNRSPPNRSRNASVSSSLAKQNITDSTVIAAHVEGSRRHRQRVGKSAYHGGVVEASDLVGGERDGVRPFAAQAGGGDLSFLWRLLLPTFARSFGATTVRAAYCEGGIV